MKNIWINPGLLPIHFALVLDKKTWKRECKRFKCEIPFPDSDGRCTTFENKKTGSIACIVTIKSSKNRSDSEIIGLIAHESMHVFQVAIETMQEKNPSPEFAAYTVQYIVQCIHEQYLKSKKPGK
jgi:hypothetical protein